MNGTAKKDIYWSAWIYHNKMGEYHLIPNRTQHALQIMINEYFYVYRTLKEDLAQIFTIQLINIFMSISDTGLPVRKHEWAWKLSKIVQFAHKRTETYGLKINCQGLNSGFCLKTLASLLTSFKYCRQGRQKALRRQSIGGATPLFVNNGLPLQCFVYSEPSDAPVLHIWIWNGVIHSLQC